jgi:hypothetical protein
VNVVCVGVVCGVWRRDASVDRRKVKFAHLEGVFKRGSFKEHPDVKNAPSLPTVAELSSPFGA